MQLAAQEVLHHSDILHKKRLIQGIFGPDGLEGFSGGSFAQKHLGGVAGRKLHDAKDEEVDQAYDEGDQFEDAITEVEEDISTEEKISDDENKIDQDSVEDNSKIKDEAQLDIEELPEVKSDEIIETEPDELAETDEF